jgi:hypothetical protein
LQLQQYTHLQRHRRHGTTFDAISDLDLSCTPPPGSPSDAIHADAQAWTRQAHSG